jgi:hypothetical protein
MMHVFLHADKGVFPLMSRVVFQPGVVAREYIEGKRKIFNPFQYLVFAVGIVFFLMAQSQFYENVESINNKNISDPRLPKYFREGVNDFYAFTKNYSNVITFASLPLYAFFSWLAFKKRGQNFAEHLTIVVFGLCQVYTFTSILMLGLIVFNSSGLGTATTLSFTLILVCFSIVYKQFYKLDILSAIWKGLVVVITAYITQMLIMIIGMLLYIFLIKR